MTCFGPLKDLNHLKLGHFGIKQVQKGSHFSKSDCRPIGIFKQVFLPCLKPMLTRFGPKYHNKRSKMGQFQGKTGSKWFKNAFFQQ